MEWKWNGMEWNGMNEGMEWRNGMEWMEWNGSEWKEWKMKWSR